MFGIDDVKGTYIQPQNQRKEYMYDCYSENRVLTDDEIEYAVKDVTILSKLLDRLPAVG
jgi:hypothetical protein